MTGNARFRAPLRRSTWCLVLMLASASCALLEADEDSFTLINRGSLPLVAVAVELETSHRFDPAQRLEVDEEDGRIIAPGASRTFGSEETLGGYQRGRDVRIFLYEVRDAEAVLGDARTLSDSELAERDFRVEIP